MDIALGDESLEEAAAGLPSDRYGEQERERFHNVNNNGDNFRVLSRLWQTDARRAGSHTRETALKRRGSALLIGETRSRNS